jgi:hypothetical protein
MIIKRVTPLSAAKVAGTLYFVLGLIFGALFSLIAIAGGMASMGESHGGPAAAYGMLFGVGAIVAFPIFYGVMGFLGAFVMAQLYNALAGAVGGVEIEVE